MKETAKGKEGGKRDGEKGEERENDRHCTLVLIKTDLGRTEIWKLLGEKYEKFHTCTAMAQITHSGAATVTIK